MSDRETLSVIQRSAQRWANERGAYWCSELQPDTDDATLVRLIRDIDEQGWFPEAFDSLGSAPTLTLAHLGRAIAREVPAAFLPILSHCLGLRLLQGSSAQLSTARVAPIATSPYIDYSRSAPPVSATPSDNGWVLSGELPWLVNATDSGDCAVVAVLPTGTKALFEVKVREEGCMLSGRQPVFGLWGVGIRRLALSSVRVSAEAQIATGSSAEHLLSLGYRTVRWGALGMLLGILERLAGEAHAYSTIRRQGGRKIIDHAPVRRMLDAMTETTDLFAHWLQRLESCPDLDYSGVEIRRQALRASDYGLQIFGGGGYVCPSLSERCWRDVRQVVALCGN